MKVATMNREALEKRAHGIADLRRMARRSLPKVAFDFIDGGAEDEETLRRNEADFDDWAFWPRPLSGSTARDLSIELFGHQLALPVLVGPTGLAGLFWPRGEVAAARAAHRAGTVYALSHGSCLTIEEVAREAPGPKWFQVFMYRDRGLTRAFAERAQAAGYQALILTTDNQVLGQRERDLRNGFTIPPRPTVWNSLDMALRLPWLLRMRQTLPGLTFANYVTDERKDILSLGKYMADILDPAASWADVEWLRKIWSGPFLLKGILHPEEARLAIDHGVDGVIVSNHGGRQLDGAISSVRALPAVVDAVAGRIPVLIDGGIRRGADVVKALALGASACLIGRPHLWGLAVAGEDGVARALEIYRSEIDRVLALGGWNGVAALERSVLESGAGPSRRAAALKSVAS